MENKMPENMMCKSHKSNSIAYIDNFDGIFNLTPQREFDPHNKKDAIELHRRLWIWLSENPSKEKDDWPEFKKIREYIFRWNGMQIKNHCFCCEYANHVYLKTEGSRSGYCSHCPIKWPGGHCEDDYSPYSKWNGIIIDMDDPLQDEMDLIISSKYALEVANLKEK